MIRPLAGIYRRLPIKPFRGSLEVLYRKYKLRNRSKVVIAVRDGIRYELDLGELIDSAIYYDGCFERNTVAVINEYVKRGMTVLDIGANIGCHTLRLAKLVGKNGKIIAFEPMAVAFKKLQRNLELNNFSNVVLEKTALSNESKGNQIVHFYANWPLTDDLHNELHHIHRGLKSEDIAEVTTLDDYVKRKGIKDIDFIKLDVDGYEYKVIQGGVNSIRRFKPVMIIEFGNYTLMEYGDSLESLTDLLASLGYSFYSESNLKEYNSREVLLKTIPTDSTINVLCKPKSSSKLENFEST